MPQESSTSKWDIIMLQESSPSYGGGGGGDMSLFVSFWEWEFGHFRGEFSKRLIN